MGVGIKNAYKREEALRPRWGLTSVEGKLQGQTPSSRDHHVPDNLRVESSGWSKTSTAGGIPLWVEVTRPLCFRYTSSVTGWGLPGPYTEPHAALQLLWADLLGSPAGDLSRHEGATPGHRAAPRVEPPPSEQDGARVITGTKSVGQKEQQTTLVSENYFTKNV